ncbi:hypothetical protein K3181_10805 [Qipengyuania sp. YG27]|uniref:Uncharacterized protein n=1 Tax=Qipengyuania mesophila TaxID=2867246 RepID=A0ABS7JW86_9SPHN|nr:hypothetical protein [Qipengyuania mesophila]MBX7501931.1 hypothetical protein [Qipengyuania mesophila]
MQTEVRKFAIWSVRVILAVLLFAAGVGPDEATSNISHWLSVIGWQKAAAATENLVFHPALVWTIAIILLISFAPQVGRAIAASGWSSRAVSRPTIEE